MLVEFSPWETTDTSLRLSVSKRKRPRGGLSSSSSVCEGAFPIAGSIITAKTGRRKQRSSADSSRAVLAITSPYRVSVLVSKHRGSQAGAPRTEALDAADCLHESNRLQYSCRPGKNTSFLPTSVEGDKPKTLEAGVDKIPVVFDTKNDRFWALQNGNKHLVVWDVQSEGPDHKGSKGSFVLKEPARSLDVLPNGLVIGSTVSGAIYYASTDKDSSAIQVSHLPPPNLKKEENSTCVDHAGTFLSVKEPPITTVTPGTKRKSSKASELCTFELYQVFVNGCTAKIIRNDLVPSGDQQRRSIERRKYKVATLPLCPSGTTDESSVQVKEATIVRTTIGNPDTAFLYYNLHSDSSSSTSTQYCCNIQLQNARLAHPPFTVGCGPQRLALVSPNIIAMGLNRQILLCDASTGVVFHDEPLPFSMEDDAEDYVLTSDPRNGLLVALFCNGEHLNAATTTLRVEDEAADSASLRSPFQMSLAARLSASLSVLPLQRTSNKENPPNNRLTLLVQQDIEEVKCVDLQMGNAIKLIQEAEMRLELLKQGRGYKKNSLLAAYRRSIECLGKSPIVLKASSTFDLFRSSSERKKSHQTGSSNYSKVIINPIEDAGEHMNGSHHGPKSSPEVKTAGEGINGTKPDFDPSEVTPSDTSVDGLPRDAAVKKKENGNADTIDTTSNHATSQSKDGRLPLPFVDTVTPVILRILLTIDSSDKVSKEAASSIKNDCCQVLHSLLESGNVSVRKHIDNHPNVKDFLSLLLCMACKQTKETRLRSPVDFIYDILQYCDDVSELHMVTMMHFMFCHSNALDIALVFNDTKGLCRNHRYKALSSRYLALLGSKGSQGSSFERTKSELVIAGSTVFLEAILRYSRCNQALLTVALRETFSFGQETRLLCRLLSDLVFPRSNSSTIGSDGLQGLMASTAQWIPALFDAFGDQMNNLAEESDLENLGHLHKSLSIARLETEHLLKLDDNIKQCLQMIAEEEERSDSKVNGGRQKRRRLYDDDALPGYSVERLSL